MPGIGPGGGPGRRMPEIVPVPIEDVN